MDTLVQQQLEKVLTDARYPPADVAYAVGRLRVLLGVKEVERLMGRKVTDLERKRAHVLLTADQTPEAVVHALTKP